MLLIVSVLVLELWFDIAHSLSPKIVTQQPPSSEPLIFHLINFLPCQKPLASHSLLHGCQETEKGHWQYHWTPIMRQCKHLDRTDVARPTQSQQRERRAARRREELQLFSTNELLFSHSSHSLCDSPSLLATVLLRFLISWCDYTEDSKRCI